MRLLGYKRTEVEPGITIFERMPAGRHTRSTFDTEQPWIVTHLGLSHDLWLGWPPWRSTRWTGRMKAMMECAKCGDVTVITVPIPRRGDLTPPKGGRHPARLRYMREHLHPELTHPFTWAKPLLNPAAHRGGIDLDALSMRLEADLLAAENS